MKMHKIKVGSGTESILVNVCESCVSGEDISCGGDHRDSDREWRDCKNLNGEGKSQCGCNPDWPELMEAIEAYRKHRAGLDEQGMTEWETLCFGEAAKAATAAGQAAIENYNIDLVMQADERGWSWLPWEHSALDIETGTFPKSLCICCRELKEPEVRLCADPRATRADGKYSLQSMCPECFGHLWTHLKGVPKETVTRYHERKDT
jgi:hypothetical protein